MSPGARCMSSTALQGRSSSQPATTPMRMPATTTRLSVLPARDEDPLLRQYTLEIEAMRIVTRRPPEERGVQKIYPIDKIIPLTDVPTPPHPSPPLLIPDIADPRDQVLSLVYRPYPLLPLISAPRPFHINKIYPHHQRTMEITEALERDDLEHAWHIFQDFVRHAALRHLQTGRLHSLVGLLVKYPTSTRQDYIRMREVIAELRRRGLGKVRAWEWNALMKAAGQGFRRVSLADYRSVIRVFEQWEREVVELEGLESRLVAEGSEKRTRDGTRKGKARRQLSAFHPTVRTFNIILDVATKCGDRWALEDAQSRFGKSGFAPDRFTHVLMMQQHGLAGQLERVPALLRTMKKEEVVLDTVSATALAWAYAQHGRLAVARDVYDLLRCSGVKCSQALEWSTNNPLASVPGLRKELLRSTPNHVTHIMMIQAYAYHGHIPPALEILQHFLAYLSQKRERGQLDAELDAFITAAFRGLFISFIQHSTKGAGGGGGFAGMSLQEAMAFALNLDGDSSSSSPSPASPFTLDTLDTIFRSYLSLTANLIESSSSPALPPTRFVRAILLAFAKTSDHPRNATQYAWSHILEKRLVPCPEWHRIGQGWRWTKLRKDFGVTDSR